MYGVYLGVSHKRDKYRLRAFIMELLIHGIN
jgi:hypothetical protein